MCMNIYICISHSQGALVSQGLRLEGKCYILFVYIRLNTHAYIKCNIDAYIRFLICMHILGVLLLLLATTMIALLFREFQPQSNNAAGSFVVPKTMVLSLTTVLKRRYDIYI